MEKSLLEKGIGTDSSPKKESSPTTEYILSGKAVFKHVGEDGFLQRQTILGKEWPGNSHQYEVTLPRADGKGEWITYLTIWSPLPLNYGEFVTPPETQLYITTGQGQMPFSSDKEVTRKVIDEIYRQMHPQE